MELLSEMDDMQDTQKEITRKRKREQVKQKAKENHSTKKKKEAKKNKQKEEEAEEVEEAEEMEKAEEAKAKKMKKKKTFTTATAIKEAKRKKVAQVDDHRKETSQEDLGRGKRTKTKNQRLVSGDEKELPHPKGTASLLFFLNIYIISFYLLTFIVIPTGTKLVVCCNKEDLPIGSKKLFSTVIEAARKKGSFYLPIGQAFNKEPGLLEAIQASLMPDGISWRKNDSRFVLTFKTPNSLLGKGTKVYIMRRA
jgi:site-specific DNA-cytosine methylase